MELQDFEEDPDIERLTYRVYGMVPINITLDKPIEIFEEDARFVPPLTGIYYDGELDIGEETFR